MRRKYYLLQILKANANGFTKLYSALHFNREHGRWVVEEYRYLVTYRMCSSDNRVAIDIAFLTVENMAQYSASFVMVATSFCLDAC